jgi:hypothetical protein
MDSEYYILLEERNPACKNDKFLYAVGSASYTTVVRPCIQLTSPTSAELLVLSASCGGMQELSAPYWVVIPLCACRSPD